MFARVRAIAGRAGVGIGLLGAGLRQAFMWIARQIGIGSRYAINAGRAAKDKLLIDYPLRFMRLAEKLSEKYGFVAGCIDVATSQTTGIGSPVPKLSDMGFVKTASYWVGYTVCSIVKRLIWPLVKLKS